MFLFFLNVVADQANPKILHMSFHLGCVKDFEEVARELSLDVTSWYILAADLPRTHFDGESTGNHVYNITHERARKVWEKHKNYFDQFDAIITSDTAPLSRIFLQNGWSKPLIIWICNRFDYYDGASLDGDFPDNEYYDLFRKAKHQSNVKIVGYTAYEHYYAQDKGVDTGSFIIKPVGTIEDTLRGDGKSFISEEVCQEETLFVYPRMNEDEMRYTQDQCSRFNIPTYSGVYNGPQDLKKFKGILYFPYAWSNLALFENIQQGLVHFVPSEKFIKEQVGKEVPIKYFTLSNFNLVEWYNQEYRDLFVYFDSWSELKEKMQTTDYDAMSKKLKEFGRQHRATMLGRWNKVFSDFGLMQ